MNFIVRLHLTTWVSSASGYTLEKLMPQLAMRTRATNQLVDAMYPTLTHFLFKGVGMWGQIENTVSATGRTR